MNNINDKLTEIIQDAVNDYISKSKDLNSDVWLEGYLSARLPDKTADEIKQITSTIVATINSHETANAEMSKAISEGISAEDWFAKSIEESAGSNSEKGKTALKLYSTITAAENSLPVNENQSEIIDIDSIPTEEFEEDKWNHYRLKDALKKTACEAGRSALVEISDNLYSDMVERGVGEVLSDKETIIDTLVSGADTGLKKAAAGALTVASENGIIPESSVESLSTIAHRAIESLKTFGEVFKGNMTLTEAVIEIKNTAVATVKSLFSLDSDNCESLVGESFGAKAVKIGAKVIGFVGKRVFGFDVAGAVKKVAVVAKPIVKGAVKAVKKVGSFIRNLLPF